MRRVLRITTCGVALVLLGWLTLHCWNMLRKVPQYGRRPLSSDAAAYTTAASRVGDTNLLCGFSISVELHRTEDGALPWGDEFAIRYRFLMRYPLWPRKISKLEVLNSNEVLVYLSTGANCKEHSRMVTRIGEGWAVWRGDPAGLNLSNVVDRLRNPPAKEMVPGGRGTTSPKQ